jgi:hypothetical protein
MRVRRTIESRSSIVVELLSFFWQRRWWWLTPLVVVLVGLAVLLAFAQSSALSPFIYTLF